MIRDMLLPEFDAEMATTRRVLERVPSDRLDWKPHPKSTSLGRLARHVADLPARLVPALEQDSLDVAAFPPRPEPSSTAEILEAFDRNVAAARAALARAADEGFSKSWSLVRAGKPIFTLPRLAAIRSFVFSHGIHHRAQLGVYLRLNDVPVPSMYGPTADE